MEFTDEEIIEKIYSSGIFANREPSEKYKKLLHEYNLLYESIEDNDIKQKYTELQDLKNEMESEGYKDIFKLGFSIATKILIEALNLKNNERNK